MGVSLLDVVRAFLSNPSAGNIGKTRKDRDVFVVSHDSSFLLFCFFWRNMEYEDGQAIFLRSNFQKIWPIPSILTAHLHTQRVRGLWGFLTLAICAYVHGFCVKKKGWYKYLLYTVITVKGKDDRSRTHCYIDLIYSDFQTVTLTSVSTAKYSIYDK